ncbi:MAG: efflux RND transporter periplasmic adaptor subunit [Planctomycetes bacterium]|nr:efflux RND transporter periplasmic adaptor subunit [Planctomycetota bacterium]
MAEATTVDPSIVGDGSIVEVEDGVVENAGDAPFFTKELTDRQKLTKRLLRLGVVLVMLAVFGVAAQQWRSIPAAAESQPAELAATLPVTTFVAKRVESYARERSYTGLLRESRRSQLSFQRGGELLELLVDEGQVVEAGQSLGRLDARHIRAARAVIEAQVAEAKAILEELVAGPRQETIAAKRAELLAQESQRRVLAGQLERRKQLVRSASVSREEYETFVYDYQAAAARVDVVKRQLDELLAGTRVEKIAAQRARLGQLDAQMTDLVHDLEDTKLVAPFAGRVSRRFVDEGSILSSGTPVLEVIDDTNLEAWIGLPPRAALALQVGEEHELMIAGKPIMATVQSLAPDVQQTSRTRNVILCLQPGLQTVLPGQVVRLAVTEQVDESGFWVPTTALTRGTRGLWSLFVVQDDFVGRCDVEVLDTVGTASFVRGTLQAGDAVIASGTHRVVAGQRVSADRSEEYVQSLERLFTEPRP